MINLSATDPNSSAQLWILELISISWFPTPTLLKFVHNLKFTLATCPVQQAVKLFHFSDLNPSGKTVANLSSGLTKLSKKLLNFTLIHGSKKVQFSYFSLYPCKKSTFTNLAPPPSFPLAKSGCGPEIIQFYPIWMGRWTSRGFNLE